MKKKGIHVGIILDGNRRYAKKKKLRPWQGHETGASKVKELIDWSSELGVRELTLYSFSVENFQRPKREVEFLFKIFRSNIQNLRNEREDGKKVKINFIGRISMFPEDIYKDMKGVMDETKKNNGLIVNFAMAYGGRAEIVDAVKKIAGKACKGEIDIEKIDEKVISDNLYMADEPDLIIRPGGEKRVSNFLIWQGYYSEWYFTDKLWPEFTREMLKNAIQEFCKRERRYGK